MANTTGFGEIIVAAKLLIDDIRWQEELEFDPAKFFRAKSDYVMMALPLLNRPPDLLTYLQKGLVKPSYNSLRVDVPEQGAVINVPGGPYDVVSCVRIGADNIEQTRYDNITYDAEEGTVTFPAQDLGGYTYEIDLYADGSCQELTSSMMRLFALAVAVVWDQRFDRNWLNMQMKIKDSSFSTAAEGQYAEKISQRYQRNTAMFVDELRKFEQDIAYHNVVPIWRRPKSLKFG